MHITVLRDDLLNGVGPIQAVVETKRSLPILSHLLLETSSSHLSVFGTDLDIGVRKRIPGEVVKEGSIALSARKLYEIVRELPATSLDLIVDDELTATITCGHSEFKIKGLPRNDFPSMREPQQRGIVLDRRLFRDLIRRTLFAVSSDQTRYTLNGILFRVTSSDVKMVATDGHRLAMASSELSVTNSESPATIDVIIPRKAAAETLKLLRDEPGDVAIEISDNHLLLHTDDTLIDARLIEGQFPNYEQVIPANATKEVAVNREAFIAALRRTSTVLGERALPTTMKLTPGKLVLTCVNLDLGEARDRLDVEYQHEEMSIGFNARYILDFLGVLTTDQAIIRLQDPLSPALFTSKDDTQYACVIMPMRL